MRLLQGQKKFIVCNKIDSIWKIECVWVEYSVISIYFSRHKNVKNLQYNEKKINKLHTQHEICGDTAWYRALLILIHKYVWIFNHIPAHILTIDFFICCDDDDEDKIRALYSTRCFINFVCIYLAYHLT